MGEVTPVRVALRYRERRFQDLKAIINSFFEWRDIQPLEDYSLHICSSQYSSPLYLVLDLYCKTCPDVNLSTLDIKVFKVSGCDPFTFVDLGEAAREKAYQRSLSIKWGD
ncbi:hypothetical protein G3M48_007502 [Beauveria asiatica]|uniref:Uncharacterized protein n=1 Tax=Beauveria asiatica TaxID=1069075 RepID=A0AAW0RMY2_9HYPO